MLRVGAFVSEAMWFGGMDGYGRIEPEADFGTREAVGTLLEVELVACV